MSTDKIEHQGIVKQVKGQDVIIGFTQPTSCASCYAKGYCSASEMQEKNMHINAGDTSYAEGEQVTISIHRVMGLQAVALSYILPAFLFLTSLIISSLFIKELFAGLLSLGILVLYFTLLYLQRDNIDKRFSFHIQKSNNQ
ncbi:MAG: SoxR reducing system RseC family protein [Bacteroidota bacterium]